MFLACVLVVLQGAHTLHLLEECPVVIVHSHGAFLLLVQVRYPNRLIKLLCPLRN